MWNALSCQIWYDYNDSYQKSNCFLAGVSFFKDNLGCILLTKYQLGLEKIFRNSNVELKIDERLKEIPSHYKIIKLTKSTCRREYDHSIVSFQKDILGHSN